MAIAAKSSMIAADFPALFTVHELERWVDTLPALDRAELSWAQPGLKAALDELLTKPLSREGIEAATLGYARVSLGCWRLLQRTIHGELPIVAMMEALRAEVPRRFAFLGSAVTVSQIDLSMRASARTVKLMLQSVFAEQGAGRAEPLIGDQEDLDRIAAAVLTDVGMGSWMRANIFMAALVELSDRGGAPKLGQELARLMVIATTDAVEALRFQGTLDAQLPPEEPLEEHMDRLLEARAKVALYDLSPVYVWARSLIPPFLFSPWLPAPEPSSKVSSRLVRLVTEVSAVSFLPEPMVYLGTAGGYTTTPAIIERAFALRGQPVRALTLSGPTPRLLRLDLVTEDSVPDPEVRARDMLRDWNELLHRLAQ